MADIDNGPVCDVFTCLTKAQWRVKSVNNSLWRDLCTPHFAAIVGEEEMEQVLRLPIKKMAQVRK